MDAVGQPRDNFKDSLISLIEEQLNPNYARLALTNLYIKRMIDEHPKGIDENGGTKKDYDNLCLIRQDLIANIKITIPLILLKIETLKETQKIVFEQDDYEKYKTEAEEIFKALNPEDKKLNAFILFTSKVLYKYIIQPKVGNIEEQVNQYSG